MRRKPKFDPALVATVQRLARQCLNPPVPGDPDGDARRMLDELPEHLGVQHLYPWMDARGLNPDEAYRRRFRHVAILLRMGQAFRRRQATPQTPAASPGLPLPPQ